MNQIPLEGGAQNAHQTFSVELVGREITFKLDWCGYVDMPFWNLDLLERGLPLVLGLKLVPGCDLIGPYKLDLGQLWLVGEEPTLDNLGVDNQLVWIEPNESI